MGIDKCPRIVFNDGVCAGIDCREGSLEIFVSDREFFCREGSLENSVLDRDLFC